jgi:hypothetical protein
MNINYLLKLKIFFLAVLFPSSMLSFPIDEPSYEDDWTSNDRNVGFRRQITRHMTFEENRRLHRDKTELENSYEVFVIMN